MLLEPKLLKRVYIIPGLACNLKCRYCYLHGETTTHVAKSVSKDTVRFLQSLAEKPEYQKLRGKDRISVLFFGGEPLLYFDLLRELYERVAVPNVFCWEMVTNGLLLDKAKVDWFNEHSIRVLISHDGPNIEMTRGIDVFKNTQTVSFYKALENPAIETVLTAYNQDVYGYKDYMRSLLGDSFKARLMFLMTSPSTPLDLVGYDLDSWAKTCEKMVSRFRNNEKGCDVNLILNYLKAFQMNFNRQKDWRCATRAGTIRLTLDGKLLDCQSSLCGNLQFGVESHFKQMESTISFSFRKNRQGCFSCPYFAFCRSHCPLIVPSQAQEKQCQFMKVFFESLVSLLR